MSDQDEHDEDCTDDRSPDTTKSGERELLDRVTLDLPGLTESNVGDTDSEPGEKGRETREGEKPIKYSRSNIGQVDVGDGGEDEDGADGPERSTRLVNVGENLGGVAGLGKGSEGSGSGVHT